MRAVLEIFSSVFSFWKIVINENVCFTYSGSIIRLPGFSKLTNMTSSFAEMTSSSIFWRCFVSVVRFIYWFKFQVNTITGSWVMTIYFCTGLTRNPEIVNTNAWFCPSIKRLWKDFGIPNLASMSLMKCC